MVAGLEVPSLVDALVDALRADVLSGELPAGAIVTEQEIAGRWDVARPTARAAIERVVQSGILRRSANKSARVPLLSPDDIADLYLSRIVFERSVVRALAINGAVPEPAMVALSEMQDAISSDSFLDTASGDIKFHHALVGGSGSKRLIKMFATVVEEAHLCIAQEQRSGRLSRETNYREHRAIADAIEAHDSAQADQLIVEHLRAAAERLIGAPLNIDHWLS